MSPATDRHRRHCVQRRECVRCDRWTPSLEGSVACHQSEAMCLVDAMSRFLSQPTCFNVANGNRAFSTCVGTPAPRITVCAVTSRNTPTHIPRTPRPRVTTPANSCRSSAIISAENARGSNPLSSTIGNPPRPLVSAGFFVCTDGNGWRTSSLMPPASHPPFVRLFGRLGA